jgi:transketolase
VLRDCEGTPDAIVIATGSEVDLAVKAAEAITDAAVRVVSMPATDVFDAQDAEYRESVLPAAVTARVAVEAAVTDGWWKYVGAKGAVVGINRFGESAPAGDLFKAFGFTVENVVAAIRGVL